jgi:hypothetical protein
MVLKKKKKIISVVKGSHLIVTTYEDGSTKLTWDDEQLLLDVRKAIHDYEMNKLKPNIPAKEKKKVKKV